MSNPNTSATADRRKKYLGLILCTGLFVAATAGQMDANAKKEISEEGLTELFNAALFHVRNDYVDDVSRQQLMFGAIRGMLTALDDAHTRFMTAEETNELQTEMRGNFGGLGIEISQRDNVLTVVSPIEDTPAMRAGIKPGDKIIEIDKKTTRDLSLSEAVKQLRGKPGTSVNISVVREGEDEILSFDLVREVIKIQVVTSQFLEAEKLGYVRLKQFNQTATEDLAKALADFKKRKAKGVILDLRWNPGGLLDAAHRISNFFIKSGVIVSTRGRKKELDRVFNADPSAAIAADLPLVVLANEGSASASEIVTGAIKDHKRGKFVGVKTFGKGSVQNVISMMYGTSMALTIQKYYTPSGVSIHKKGIEPDINVPALDFNKDDRRHYKEIREKKILQDFVKENKVYNAETVRKFQKMVAAKGLTLTDYAAKRALKDELTKSENRPVFDLEFDVQLQRAITELKK
ncbi:MAG TPA: S41 family peptidase [Turneriella sp.]|nr:S41 family peptidase [Turneriella sp.]HNL09229.1 S41 family peptidase [Turneriella sp.]